MRLQCESDGQPQAQAGMANDIYPRPNALTRHYETQPVPHYPGTNGLRQAAAPGLTSHERVINAARQVLMDRSWHGSKLLTLYVSRCVTIAQGTIRGCIAKKIVVKVNTARISM